MEKPLMIFQKTADKARNRIIIPKVFIEKWGINYAMEVYENKIILLPVKKGE